MTDYVDERNSNSLLLQHINFQFSLFIRNSFAIVRIFRITRQECEQKRTESEWNANGEEWKQTKTAAWRSKQPIT